MWQKLARSFSDGFCVHSSDLLLTVFASLLGDVHCLLDHLLATAKVCGAEHEGEGGGAAGQPAPSSAGDNEPELLKEGDEAAADGRQPASSGNDEEGGRNGRAVQAVGWLLKAPPMFNA